VCDKTVEENCHYQAPAPAPLQHLSPAPQPRHPGLTRNALCCEKVKSAARWAHRLIKPNPIRDQVVVCSVAGADYDLQLIWTLVVACFTGVLTQGSRRGATRPPWPRDCIGFLPTSY
jgi:hypothetical protein